MLIGGTITVIKFGVIDKSPYAGIGAPFIVLGIGVSVWGLQIRYLIGNQREISAYMAQQQIPINKENLEKMSPSMGTAAKEIAKGVKEELSNDNKIYCKYCGAQIDSDSSFCKNCGKKLV